MCVIIEIQDLEGVQIKMSSVGRPTFIKKILVTLGLYFNFMLLQFLHNILFLHSAVPAPAVF